MCRISRQQDTAATLGDTNHSQSSTLCRLEVNALKIGRSLHAGSLARCMLFLEVGCPHY